MDFSKLNIEFNNMQNIIAKYNILQQEIKNKIKNNLKDISRYETKLKNTKNKIEISISNLFITMLKDENEFLESLEKDKGEKNEKSF